MGDNRLGKFLNNFCTATHDIIFMSDSCVTRSELTVVCLNTGEYFWARVETSLDCLHFILIA